MIPDPSEWYTLKEMAKLLGVTYKRLHKQATQGRKVDGNVIKLQTWRTLKGIVTTKKAVCEFHYAINPELQSLRKISQDFFAIVPKSPQTPGEPPITL